MALKKSQLYSSLWQSCDELRGGMDASQYKDYVLVLFPPVASPVQSSRLMNRCGPPRYRPNRSIGSNGVGKCEKCSRSCLPVGFTHTANRRSEQQLSGFIVDRDVNAVVSNPESVHSNFD